MESTELDGMTDIAHLVFTQRAMPLPTAPALMPLLQAESKTVAPSELESALPEKPLEDSCSGRLIACLARHSVSACNMVPP